MQRLQREAQQRVLQQQRHQQCLELQQQIGTPQQVKQQSDEQQQLLQQQQLQHQRLMQQQQLETMQQLEQLSEEQQQLLNQQQQQQRMEQLHLQQQRLEQQQQSGTQQQWVQQSEEQQQLLVQQQEQRRCGLQQIQGEQRLPELSYDSNADVGGKNDLREQNKKPPTNVAHDERQQEHIEAEVHVVNVVSKASAATTALLEERRMLTQYTLCTLSREPRQWEKTEMRTATASTKKCYRIVSKLSAQPVETTTPMAMQHSTTPAAATM